MNDSGATRSHTDAFKGVRDARVDHFVVETNKLLIRLDKLIGPDSPLEPNKRKGIPETERLSYTSKCALFDMLFDQDEVILTKKLPTKHIFPSLQDRPTRWSHIVFHYHSSHFEAASY